MLLIRNFISRGKKKQDISILISETCENAYLFFYFMIGFL